MLWGPPWHRFQPAVSSSSSLSSSSRHIARRLPPNLTEKLSPHRKSEDEQGTPGKLCKLATLEYHSSKSLSSRQRSAHIVSQHRRAGNTFGHHRVPLHLVLSCETTASLEDLISMATFSMATWPFSDRSQPATSSSSAINRHIASSSSTEHDREVEPSSKVGGRARDTRQALQACNT
jgi:hypothetical protein